MIRGSRFFMVLLAGIMLIGFVNLGSVSAEDTVSYTDPSGDVENDGVNTEGENNADIVSLSMDYSGDPLVIELTVVGKIIHESSDMMHQYEIQIDHTGSKQEETTIDINNIGAGSSLFTSDFGSDQTLTTQYSGNGTSKLRIEIPMSWFTGDPGFSDIFAETQVTSSNFMYNAEDAVNEDFQGGGAGDDDDDTPGELYLPPGEDPAQATPTDPSLSIDISDFESTFTIGATDYELVQEAEGTGSSSIDKCAYTLVYYPKSGSPSVSWQTGPLDTTQDFGQMSYEERFQGKVAEESWDSWEWYFKSTGPSDTSEVQKYKEDSGYWDTINKVVLFVRAFDESGAWNQDSMDVTDKFDVEDSTGDDDTDDDDTSDGNETGDDKDDSPAPGMMIIAGSIMISIMIASIVMGRKR